MHNAVSYEISVFQGRYERKNSFLLGKFKICLKSHHIIECTLTVFLSQLQNSPRTVSCFWICKSDRLHRPEPYCIFSTLCHNLYRHTALVNLRITDIYIFKSCSFCVYKLSVKYFVFFLVKRTVYIIIGTSLSVSACGKRIFHIYGFGCDYRCGGIKKAQRSPKPVPYIFSQQVGSKRSCSYYTYAVIRYFGYFLGYNGYVGVRFYFLSDHSRKIISVYGKCSACRNTAFIGTFQQKRTQHTHFLFKHTCRTGKSCRLK